MALSDSMKKNFNTLCNAFKNNDTCLIEAYDKNEKKTVPVICMVNRYADGTVELLPIARLYDGEQWDNLIPPMAEEKPHGNS